MYNWNIGRIGRLWLFEKNKIILVIIPIRNMQHHKDSVSGTMKWLQS